MSTKFQVSGTNAAALFSLKLHRGDGMTLLAMNWKNGTPPKDSVPTNRVHIQRSARNTDVRFNLSTALHPTSILL
jgi:hypothetical protein